MELSQEPPEDIVLPSGVSVRVFQRKKGETGWDYRGEMSTVNPVVVEDRMFLVNLETDRCINTSPIESAVRESDTIHIATRNSEYDLKLFQPEAPAVPHQVTYVAEGIAKAAKGIIGSISF